MKASMLIDYLTFSVKPIRKEIPFDLNFIMDFLGLDLQEFVMVGSRMHYAYCYVSQNGVNVYQASSERFLDMGICVSMSGNGCRYYESFLKDGNFCSLGEIWKSFFRRLRELNYVGYSVNISRLDIAVDDKAGEGEPYFLNLDLIERCANGREFVSRFRTIEDITTKKIYDGKLTGRCIYFGSMKSSAFCRFYDKLIEQRMKRKGDAEALAQLDRFAHWVRMEFVFKKKQAIKIVNAICDSVDFSKFFAEIVNGYVRFVEPDNDNTSRRTVKPWWFHFIGVLIKSSLSVGNFEQRNFAQVRQYYLKYLSTTVFTLMSRLSPDEFFGMTCGNASGRLKKKHLRIIHGKDTDEVIVPNMGDWWRLLNPIHKERLA